MRSKYNGARAYLTVESESDDHIASELDLKGHKVVVELDIRAETYYYPEKRVDGNPTHIESEAESGVNIKSVSLEKLSIDDVEQTKEVMNEYQSKYQDTLLGIAEDYEDNIGIEWEYEEDYYD